MAELFRVYIGDDGIKICINERALEDYGLTLEEFDSKWDKTNTKNGIDDFINTLVKNDKKGEK